VVELRVMLRSSACAVPMTKIDASRAVILITKLPGLEQTRFHMFGRVGGKGRQNTTAVVIT
jgi:hypothetical protein